MESRDFMEMQQVWEAWDHRYDQISPGAFRGSIHYTQTGSLGISRNRWERAIHYRGGRGFNHVGQFSRDYRQLFGELPSETLQRY
jgi:hypothetical protein